MKASNQVFFKTEILSGLFWKVPLNLKPCSAISTIATNLIACEYVSWVFSGEVRTKKWLIHQSQN